MTGKGLISQKSMEAEREFKRQLRAEAEEELRVEQAEAEHVVGRLVSTSSPATMALIGGLNGVFWEYQKRLLDIMETICHSDRQWQTVRRVAQDIQGEQLRRSSAVLRQALAQLEESKEKGS